MGRSYAQLLEDAAAHGFTGTPSQMADAELLRTERAAKQRQKARRRAAGKEQAADRRYYERNRDQILKRMKEWGEEYRSRPEVAERSRQYSEAWRLANPEKRRVNARRHHAKQHARSRLDLWQEQGGRCYLCGDVVPEPIDPTHSSAVDHDHRCCASKVSCDACCRGLACIRCNMGIGLFSDDPERMRRVADALEAAQRGVSARMAGQLELGL